jgi:hypothetical protein
VSANGKPVFIAYQDKSPRTHDFVSFRIPVELATWLRDITKLASKGHAANCLCPACRTRRELEGS